MKTNVSQPESKSVKRKEKLVPPPALVTTVAAPPKNTITDCCQLEIQGPASRGLYS